MESMPPEVLGGVISMSFLAILLLHPVFSKRMVHTRTASSQPMAQFFTSLTLISTMGGITALFNIFFLHFPVVSAGLFVLGYLIVGFFISLDMALFRQLIVIQETLAQGATLIPKRLYSISRKFLVIAFATALIVAMTVFLVISRDIAWLMSATKDENLSMMANRSVLIEILFVIGIVLGYTINLIVSFSRNLKLLFQNQTSVLEKVANGDFSRMVPVATNDEFGLIAGYTNRMIKGLKHRIQLISALKIAEDVQQNLMPRIPPEFQGLDISGKSIYCDETGGDYYDYLNLSDSRIGVVIADAADHGVGSALQMTSARAFLRFGAKTYQGPALLLNEVNRFLSQDSADSGRFMTMFFIEIDTNAQSLRWVRAGHEPGLLYDPHQDRFEELMGEGLALGIDETFVYEDNLRLGWLNQHILFIGTDGIREARNKQGEFFGVERIRQIIRNQAHHDSKDIQNALIGALREFHDQKGWEDDITLVIIKFK
ncbi:MAG: PP2C family protein-serine/threonine phosphatase [Desulfatirhabdiaceae bacterium]